MGNSSSRLKRDTSIISRPRLLTSPQAPPPLGPAVVVSPEVIHSHTSLLSSNSVNHVSRRSTFDVSRASPAPVDVADVRRSRTANASPGPTREDRASLLGAPPPYSAAVASSSAHDVSADEFRRDGLLATPELHAPRPHHAHRRTQSAINPGDRTDPRIRMALGGEEQDQRPLPPLPPGDAKLPLEELGYGAGRYVMTVFL